MSVGGLTATNCRFYIIMMVRRVEVLCAYCKLHGCKMDTNSLGVWE